MKNRILIIEDSLSFSAYLCDLLSDVYEVIPSYRADEGLRKAVELSPQIILLDLVLPDSDGYDVLRRIKGSESAKDIPVIFISAVGEIKDQTKGLELGAADYIVKPINPDIVRAKIKNHIEIKQNFDRLENISLKDPLTLIGNRRLFDERIDSEWRRAKRDGFSLGLFMIDIDYFKNYNDSLGHIEGDKCLKSIAGAIEKSLKRGGDIVVRYGGEEFAAILPGINYEASQKVASRIFDNISCMNINHPDSPISEYVTVSIGGAVSIPCAEEDMSGLVKKADSALYAAKNSGRNKYIFSETPF